MECERATKRYPDGRRGTWAGAQAHRKAKEPLCDECHAAARQRGKEQYASNPDTWKSHYAKNKHQIAERKRQRYWADPEAARQRARGYVRENPDVVQRSRSNYLARHAEQAAHANRDNRRRRRAAKTIPFTGVQLHHRLSMFAGCYICGSTTDLVVDHVKPLAKGGIHALVNLRPACRACNSRKHARWQGSTWAHNLTLETL